MFFQLNKSDFHESISKLGFADELQTELYKLYSDNRQEMRQTLSTMSMGLPYYHNLEWRFEVKVCTTLSLRFICHYHGSSFLRR